MKRVTSVAAVFAAMSLAGCKTTQTTSYEAMADSTAEVTSADGVSVNDFTDLTTVLQASAKKLGACDLKMIGNSLYVTSPDKDLVVVPFHVQMGAVTQWKNGVLGATKDFVNSGKKTVNESGTTVTYDLATISRDEFVYFSHYELVVSADVDGKLKQLTVQESIATNVFGLKVGKIYADPSKHHDCQAAE